ncbi:peptidoglycan-binding domain-containing protein [Kribbella sp. NPDC051770]|uniref:peptidoglycan-binding domain-containing protein n=1 Tax=Kribbella sp. NPDC051770 TaxID=3155413 RepID=UPI0034225EE3
MSDLRRFWRHVTTRRTAVVLTAAAVAAVPLTFVASSASAGTQALTQCQQVYNKTVNSAGWTVPALSIWEESSTVCNLKPGDLPHRDPRNPFGDPETAIKTLQRNLNYCYGSKLTVDGRYGARTEAAVAAVQRRHGLTADGIYGPATRSAMNWRLWNPKLGLSSDACYSPL